MVLIEVDERTCSRCHQPFQDGDKVDIERDCECNMCGGGPKLLHDKCPEDALFNVARAECMRCGKVHRLAGEKIYMPRQILLIPCCMGSGRMQIRVTGRWKEGDKE